MLRQRKKYVNSIEDLTLWSWWKIQDTNDYSYLSNKKLEKDNTLTSSKLFESIYNEFISVGGLGKTFSKIAEMKKNYHLLKSKALLENCVTSKMKAKLLKIDIDNMEKQQSDIKGVSREDALISISEQLGSKLNSKQINVLEFQNYLKYYSKKR